jgi:hypothetical protein
MARGRPPKDEPERKSDHISFRARPGLRARLIAAAEKSERTVSQEIEHRLERSFERDELLQVYRDRTRELAGQANFLAEQAKFRDAMSKALGASGRDPKEVLARAASVLGIDIEEAKKIGTSEKSDEQEQKP